MSERNLEHVIASVAASDGAGVKLRRSVGVNPFARHDPFLMLNEFFSDDPNDDLAGRPIGEPVVQYGAFVMNAREEIEQAIADYQSGAFAREPVGRIRIAPRAD